MSTRPQHPGLLGIVALHLFVRDLERSRQHFMQRLDFVEVAVSTPAFERHQRARASVLEAGAARFVLLEPLGSQGESCRWLAHHPEGVGRVVFDVADIDVAHAFITSRGGTPTAAIERQVVEGVPVAWFDITTVIGDTLFRFVQHGGCMPLMPHMQRVPAPAQGGNRFGVVGFDHLTANFLTLHPAVSWMAQVLGLQRYWGIAFHTEDHAHGALTGSGLKSTVMWDPHSGLKFANNEPAAPHFEASQIYRFCVDHGGAGVQHAALAVEDIMVTVEGLRARGVQFMSTPAAYYAALPQRLAGAGIAPFSEDVQQLQALGILVDGNAADGYLLQIFLREAAGQFHDVQAGPFFLELIQRKGDRGFGGGNFRALFESIEREQQLQRSGA